MRILHVGRRRSDTVVQKQPDTSWNRLKLEICVIFDSAKLDQTVRSQEKQAC